MPGPVLFVTVRHSATYGRWVGPLVVIGHALVEVPLVAAVILGLDKLLGMDAFVGAIGLAGGAVLLVMGGAMLRAAPGLTLPSGPHSKNPRSEFRPLKVIGSGALTSVSNPYFTVWWATVGLNFIAHAMPSGVLGYSVFYGGHILADLVWYSGVAESVHQGRRFLSDRSYRGLIGACAALLICFGAYFGYTGWDFLFGS